MKYRNEDKHCTGDKIQSTCTIKQEFFCNYSITNMTLFLYFVTSWAKLGICYSIQFHTLQRHGNKFDEWYVPK